MNRYMSKVLDLAGVVLKLMVGPSQNTLYFTAAYKAISLCNPREDRSIDVTRARHLASITHASEPHTKAIT